MEKACEIIFTDILEDSEVRILAFKVFAINPSKYKASVIKNVLDDKKCQLQSMIKKNILHFWSDIKIILDDSIITSIFYIISKFKRKNNTFF
jgi:uncharacterized protein YbcI